jgi:hypothetical protein
MIFRLARTCTALLAATLLAFPQSPEVGKRKHLIYHDIQTDAKGHIVPWYDPDPAVAYDHVLSLVWNYWKYVPNYWSNDPPYRDRYHTTAGVKKYFVFRTLDDMGVGGDQFAMALSSWSLYYAYTGDPAVFQDLRDEADMYIANSLSAKTAAWPNIPYPCNTTRLAVYDGDLVAGKGYTQPDKAGSFGGELVTLYKMTGDRKYLEVALGIANTLASKTQSGDAEHSPLPFRVQAETGQVKDPYTSNWTGTLRLFEGLIGLKEGDTSAYQSAHRVIGDWLKQYPIKNSNWGPFFEDIPQFSQTEINAGTLAHYILEHPDWDPNWREDSRRIQDWVIANLGLDYWKQYGLTVIAEQTAYRMQGQSHSSRHASVELEYAEKTGDTSRKEEAIRLLNWATYPVDYDGKNWYPNFEVYEIWWTDGYADYVRHYMRAMAAAPELAPPGKNHLLRTSSVCKHITYAAGKVIYETFDDKGSEVFRLASKPKVITCGGKRVGAKDWTWQPLNQGGVLRLTRGGGTNIEITL